MARIAALMVIAAQGILLWLVADMSGRTATAFSFLGHPLLGLGLLLGLIALVRRLRREAAAREEVAARADR